MQFLTTASLFFSTRFLPKFLMIAPMLDGKSLVKNVINWILAIVLVGVGGWLMVVALFDLRQGLGQTGNKDWKTAIIGIFIGAIAAFLFYMAVGTWQSILKNVGNDIPKS